MEMMIENAVRTIALEIVPIAIRVTAGIVISIIILAMAVIKVMVEEIKQKREKNG